MSTLEDGMDNLSSVDYTDQIEAIIQVLKQTPKILFIDPTSASFDIDAIASKVSAQFVNSTKYPFENKQDTTYASSYFDDIAKKRAFSNQIGELKQQIVQMDEIALQSRVGHGDIQRYATSLLKPIADFSSASSGGLKYPLTKAFLFEKQR